MTYFTTARNNKSVTCSCIPNCFYLVLWVKLAMRSVQSFKKSFFSVFIRLDHFPQVYKQLKEWLILQLYETMRMLHIVVCPIVFLLFYERGWQRGVFKVMKNDLFLVFLVIWVLFSKFLGMFKGWLMIQLHKIIRASHAIGCPIVFLLFYEWGWQGGVFIIMKNDHFLEFLAVWVLFPKFLSRWEVSYIRNVWNNKVVALPMDFNLVCDLGQQLGVLKMLLFWIFISFWAFSLTFRIS